MAREKLYYSISEVAQLLDVEESTLRFWEKAFGKPKPVRRVERGPRLYRAEDIDTLRQIHHLLREQGMTIEGAKRQLKHNRSAIAGKTELILCLRRVKEELIAFQEAFDHLPISSSDEEQQT